MVASIVDPEKGYVARASVSNLRSLKRPLQRLLKMLKKADFHLLKFYLSALLTGELIMKVLGTD